MKCGRSSFFITSRRYNSVSVLLFAAAHVIHNVNVYHALLLYVTILFNWLCGG